MSELTDVFDAIKSREAVRGVARAEQRARNRADFPQAAKVMDALARFAPRLIWAEENGNRIGRANVNAS